MSSNTAKALVNMFLDADKIPEDQIPQFAERIRQGWRF